MKFLIMASLLLASGAFAVNKEEVKEKTSEAWSSASEYTKELSLIHI